MASSTFTPQRILIFGGTGTIGKFITASILRASPSFPSVTLFTSASTATSKTELLSAWQSRGLAIHTGDIASAADVQAALASTKADTVISCLGRGALHLQNQLVAECDASATVQWFFPSEYGTDVEFWAKSAGEKTHQGKLALRRWMRENVRRVSVTYLVTGPYFEMWTDLVAGAEEAGGFDKEAREAWLIGGDGEGEEEEGRVGFCTMWDVGKALVAALHHPSSAMSKILRVQSFVTTPSAVLAEFESQTSSSPAGGWKVHRTPLSDIMALEEKLWAEGKPQATVVTLRRIWAEGGTLYERTENADIGLGEEGMVRMEGLREAVGRQVGGGWRGERFD